MNEVTDPALLAQLNAPDSAPSPSGMREVTDPALLAQLNGTEQPHPIVSAVKGIIDNYKKSQIGSPQDVLERIDQAVTGGFNKAGQFGAEQLAKEGMNPNAAAAVGTVVQMAPDIAKLATPEEPSEPEIGDAAKGFARRALGFSKRQLNTPLAREQATNAADVALKEGILPWSGNREVMQENALALKDRTGKTLGDMRAAAGPVELQPFVDNLNAMKSDVLKGRTGGVWDQIGSKIDNAIETVKGLGGPDGKATLNDVADAKKALSDTVNWLSDLSSQKITKQVAGNLSQKIEDTVGQTGGDINAYQNANSRYGASKKMLEGIDNAMSAENGNNLFGPTATFSGIFHAANGNIPGAIASTGGIELLKRRGSSLIANLLATADRVPSMPMRSTPLLQLIAALNERNRR